MRYKPGLLAKVDHIAFLKPVPLILKSEWVKQWLEDIPATTSPLSR